jgi:hypothetical protein
LKEKIKKFYTERRRAVITVTALLIVFGITAYVLAAPSFSSPYSDATEYACVSPARFVFPDNTIVYAPQVNYTIPNTNIDNGKNALFVSAANAANPKLKTALDLVGIPIVNNQYQMFNSGSIKPGFFIGFKLTGTGGYDLYPSNLRPITDEGKRKEAYNNYTTDEYDITAMQPSVSSWYSSKKYIINAAYPRYYKNGGSGPPGASGYALDAYFLPPDLEVWNLWTLPPVGDKGKAAATFKNTYPTTVNVNLYLYAVVNGVPNLIDSRIGQPIPTNSVWQLQGDYPAGTTKLVACVGVPWNGISWESSYNNDTTTTATVPALGLTLRGKKIESGSDLYRDDTKATLRNRWNNNYRELLNPEQPGLPPDQQEQPGDMAALMLMPIDPTTQQIQAYVTPSTKFKMKFNYISGFNESGNAVVRLYEEDKEYYTKTLVSEKTVYVTKGQADVIFDPELQHSEGVYRYIATINYRWGSGWVGEPFAGKTESTYDNNKVETDVRCTVGGPPTGVGYWPPVVTKQTPIIERVPVWGWKKVEYDVEELKIKTRLVE